jgi:poly(3-hydroxybutyrate) depolymerase
LLRYDCPPGAEVDFYVVNRLYHRWPGSRALGDPGAVTATDLIWSFFEQHRRGTVDLSTGLGAFCTEAKAIEVG